MCKHKVDFYTCYKANERHEKKKKKKEKRKTCLSKKEWKIEKNACPIESF